ncbi:hypothetical protein AVEN_3158-1 [Araneus ventricosus]|uniref:Uncharacterized protein n=1 Tax=Araneus ventricosus TaxID=182803 RepID=A0A4Y2QHD2_ARAVE|nr:hypothetical protein AVEN_3158-1 [Araneus ventricosus]
MSTVVCCRCLHLGNETPVHSHLALWTDHLYLEVRFGCVQALNLRWCGVKHWQLKILRSFCSFGAQGSAKDLGQLPLFSANDLSPENAAAKNIVCSGREGHLV